MARLSLHLRSAVVALDTATRIDRLASQMRRGACCSPADRSNRRWSGHELMRNRGATPGREAILWFLRRGALRAFHERKGRRRAGLRQRDGRNERSISNGSTGPVFACDIAADLPNHRGKRDVTSRFGEVHRKSMSDT